MFSALLDAALSALIGSLVEGFLSLNPKLPVMISVLLLMISLCPMLLNFIKNHKETIVRIGHLTRLRSWISDLTKVFMPHEIQEMKETSIPSPPDEHRETTEACIQSLPKSCIATVLSFTTPRDACRLSAVSTLFRSASQSDCVWENFLPRDYQSIVSATPDLPSSKRNLYFSLCDSPILVYRAKDECSGFDDDQSNSEMRKDGWMEVAVGEFATEAQIDGTLRFKIWETQSLHRKSGMVVEGIEIRAKEVQQ